jgi:hypothetical protein
MKKVITTIGTVAVSVLSLLVILFISIEYKATEVPEDQCKIAEGVVTEINEGGIKDVVISLGGEKKFYINRGLDSKFELNVLQNEIVGKRVKISYSDHQSILANNNSSHHIRKMEIGLKTFYTEY